MLHSVSVCALLDLQSLCTSDVCVCACVSESSIATNLSPTQTQSYSFKINLKPENILGPSGSGRVADLHGILYHGKAQYCILLFILIYS